ncbi:MAG: tol-pal system protein YbgF [Nitrospirae bacterium]|nr:tol-pal system protein YbgF [Nitrospirota bacterium]
MKKLLLTVVILIFSVSGCAMQSEFVDLENEVNRMKVILLQIQRDTTPQPQREDKISQDIKERFSRIESQNSGSIDMLQKNQADYEGRLTQITTDVQIIQGGLEENTHRLTELTESSDDHDAAIQELTRRLDNLEGSKGVGDKQQGSNIIPSSPVTQETGQQPVQSNAGKTSGSTSGNSSTSNPSELYNQAYKDYMAGHYDPAIEGFYSYLRQIPTGNLAPNALYWIGECYYSKGDYTKSVTVFESVTIDYPKSDKVVGSLLKMGYGYEKLGNNNMAKIYFKKVAEQFPYSQEASLAKVRLTEIK